MPNFELGKMSEPKRRTVIGARCGSFRFVASFRNQISHVLPPP